MNTTLWCNLVSCLYLYCCVALCMVLYCWHAVEMHHQWNTSSMKCIIIVVSHVSFKDRWVCCVSHDSYSVWSNRGIAWQVIIVNIGKTSLLSTLDFAIQEMYARDDITVDIACSKRRQTRMCSLSNLVIQPVIIHMSNADWLRPISITPLSL